MVLRTKVLLVPITWIKVNNSIQSIMVNDGVPLAEPEKHRKWRALLPVWVHPERVFYNALRLDLIRNADVTWKRVNKSIKKDIRNYRDRR